MAVQAGLCRTWSETPKTGFLRTRLIYTYTRYSREDSLEAPHRSPYTEYPQLMFHWITQKSEVPSVKEDAESSYHSDNMFTVFFLSFTKFEYTAFSIFVPEL